MPSIENAFSVGLDHFTSSRDDLSDLNYYKCRFCVEVGSEILRVSRSQCHRDVTSAGELKFSHRRQNDGVRMRAGVWRCGGDEQPTTRSVSWCLSID